MPISKGTTLITLSTSEGIVMAADDLMYREQEGKAVPMVTGVPKIFALDSVLIGGTGIMRCEPIKYTFQEWIAKFIQMQRSAADKLPNTIAQALHDKMRETFEPIDAIVKHGGWESYRPGERLVSYVIAGYTKSFTKPYIYEIGTEVNTDGSGLRYIPPLYRPDDNLWIGEDEFFLLALGGKEPHASLRQSFFRSTVRDAVTTLPNLPEALQDAVASAVSLIKVEAQSNSNKVGRTVNVALIDRSSRKVFTATF